MFATAGVQASPRAQSAPDLHAQLPLTQPGEIAAWLRWLVGQYEVEGSIEAVYFPLDSGHRCDSLPGGEEGEPYRKPVKGRADCVAVGSGPGVQCMLNVTWQDFYQIIYPTVEGRRLHSCEKAIFINAGADARSILVSIDFEINEAPFMRMVATLRWVDSVAANSSMREPGK